MKWLIFSSLDNENIEQIKQQLQNEYLFFNGKELCSFTDDLHFYADGKLERDWGYDIPQIYGAYHSDFVEELLEENLGRKYPNDVYAFVDGEFYEVDFRVHNIDFSYKHEIWITYVSERDKYEDNTILSSYTVDRMLERCVDFQEMYTHHWKWLDYVNNNDK